MSTSSPCWYADCDTTIPTRVQYVPLSDGERYVEQRVVDERALLAHLTAEHPMVPATPILRHGRLLRA